MPIDAVFFDLDGTLLDTAPDLGGALNTVLIEEGLQTISLCELRKVVSNGSAALIEVGFPDLKCDVEFTRLRNRLLEIYQDTLADKTEVFPGIYELIEQCSANGISWGVATNKPWKYTAPLMKAFSFASEPSCLICPEHVKNSKPAADSLILACEQTNTTHQNALYIGDHIRDIQCGINAGMRTIAVNYGYIDSPDVTKTWNADYIVESAHDIWPIIQTLNT
ncbi:MAG: 2-phosphoglycolate phosphatase [Flavobacteriales bacterium]|jgi:2-phosphoglycolate phosphatase